MQPSSTPGAQPSVSKRLLNYLSDNADEASMAQQDEFDQLIGSKGLRIARFAFFRDVDVFLLILSNRRIISRPLSAYPSLVSATDIQLTNYTISDSGIHWPLLDVDLSLRGFLMEDAVMGLRAENSRLAA